MHEITIAKSVINQVKEKKNVQGIEIELGELAGLTYDELKQALTDLTDWKIVIQKINSKIKCKCGYIGKAEIKERQHDIVIYCCPKCKLLPDKTISGKDIKLKKIIYFN